MSKTQVGGTPTPFYGAAQDTSKGTYFLDCLRAADFGVEFRLVTKRMVSEAEWAAYGARVKLLRQIRVLNSRDPTSWKGAGFPSDQRTQSAMVYYRVAERAKRRIRRGNTKFTCGTPMGARSSISTKFTEYGEASLVYSGTRSRQN